MNYETDDRFDDYESLSIARIERDNGYGSVPGLPDEELADPAELARQAFIADWGPVLSLPVRGVYGGFRPAIDEEGELDWGAFGTVDFERLQGPFDKTRYKADKLEEQVRDAAITLDMIAARLTPESKLDSGSIP